MYAGAGYGAGYGMAGGGMGMGMAMGMNPMMGMGMAGNPNFFFFSGTSQSLQSRIDSMTDEEINTAKDANITVTGIEVKEMSMASYMCTLIWGSIILFPLFFMCMDWWKRCTYAIYDVPQTVYDSLGRLTRGGLSNLTLTVIDNCFNANKVNILYNHLSNSSLKGFTFINAAMAMDYNNHEFSHFEANMVPIRNLTNMIVDIRWQSYCCM